jgi:hypothetical protein
MSEDWAPPENTTVTIREATPFVGRTTITVCPAGQFVGKSLEVPTRAFLKACSDLADRLQQEKTSEKLKATAVK